MATPRTPQQILDAAAKRKATQAANRASGAPTVRQARAAAKAAKSGQPYTAPIPKAPKANPYGPNGRFGRGRRRHNAYGSTSYGSGAYAPNPTPQTPVFSAPKPNYRNERLVLLAQVEATVKARLNELPKGDVTDTMRATYLKYQGIKARALAPATGATPAQVEATANEANSALLVAIKTLITLAF